MGGGDAGPPLWAAMYRPTSQQRAFQELACRYLSMGKVRIGQWIYASSYDKPYKDAGFEPVTREVWDAWSEDPSFASWFFGPMDTSEVSPQERQLLDNLFWNGLAEGMHELEPWAFQLYMKAREQVQEAIGTPQQKAQLMDWLNGGSGGGKWRRPTASG